MPIPRLWRPAVACRLLHPVLFVTTCLFDSVAAIAAGEVSGVVVDQSGRPLPRALVRVVDPSGAESAAVFADEAGRFRVASVGDDCRVSVSLAAFRLVQVPCSSTQILRVVLTVTLVEETVVVTATRTEAPTTQIGASVTTFTANDLERRDQPLLADLLRTSPGGTFNFSNVTTETLDRVEVVRGAHSALFGSDAMASVVQLFTRRANAPTGRPHVAATFDGGTYDTTHAMVSASGGAGRLDYAAGVARLTTDNLVPNNRFENTTLTLNVGVAMSPSATLQFVGRGELGRAGTPGQTSFGRPDLDAFLCAS